MTDEKLIQYIKGELDEAGREEVVSWIEADEANFRHFSTLHLDDTFAGMDEAELPFDEAALRLNAAGWPDKQSKRRTKPAWWTIVTRVAALLLLPLAVAGALLLSQRNREIDRLTAELNSERIVPIQQSSSLTYTVNPGVKGDILLPDGSRVRLNSASTLRCPDRFSDVSRVVELSGEGFFEVESNPDWPMYVKTSKGVTVKVTGTTFNVSSYENDNALKLTLVEGKVTVINDADGRQFPVNPSEEMVIVDGRNLTPVTHAVDVQPAIVWKDGVLFFQNARMDEVIRKLERWYGVSIHAQDAAILNMYFTASFESESLNQVLQLLQITSNIGCRIKGKDVTLYLKQ